jgi:pilus assembly protein FimV
VNGDDVNVYFHSFSMTRSSPPTARLPTTRSAFVVPGRGRLCVAHLAVAAALGAFGANASALSLGQLHVQSALGEPLRAEIDITEIAPTDMDGLRIGIASPETFNAIGVPYNPALSDVRAGLQRRADGRYVVRLAGERQLYEPFIDLLLEAHWNSGHVVRDFTVLLDVPTGRQVAPPPPITAPQIPVPPPPPPPPRVTEPTAAQTPQAGPLPPGASATFAPSASDTFAAPAASTGPAFSGQPRPIRIAPRAESRQITVNPGDTAGRIAAAYMPANVSLDQMLVALLRANPQAFIGGNVNRVRAGAVLTMPESSQVATIPAAEARRIITAQSRDFNEYRRRLAANAQKTVVADADRSVWGKIQTQVEDRDAAQGSNDRLVISQGAAAGQPTGEQMAQDAEAQALQKREQELAQNQKDLNQLKDDATGSTGSSSPAPAAAPPAAAPTGGLTAAAPAATTPPAPAPEPEGKSFFDGWMEHPLMLAAAALIALLIGFLLYRVLGRKRDDDADDIENRSLKDAFFSTNDGQSLDTKDREPSLTPGPLDAEEINPIAEAEVYMAHNRDVQAEEVLRKALVENPNQIPVHLKLLEVYVKQRDLRAFEALLPAVRRLTGGVGDDWIRALQLGVELDLHKTSGAEPPVVKPVAAPAAAPVAKPTPTAPTAPPQPAVPPGFFNLDLDLVKPTAPASPPAPRPANAADARPEPAQGINEDPHHIKLALARELKALGDLEGARSLIEEVAAEGSGPMKTEAQQLLGQLH